MFQWEFLLPLVSQKISGKTFYTDFWTSTFDCLYNCGTFVIIVSSFDDIQVLIFYKFGLKMPIHILFS